MSCPKKEAGISGSITLPLEDWDLQRWKGPGVSYGGELSPR